MRKKIIAGNWKMNAGPGSSEKIAKDILKNIDKSLLKKADVVICPPFISIESVSKIIAGSGIKLGAQNLSYEAEGAFTGEVSAKMLKDAGCEYVIVGHSERRKLFHETDSIVNKKVKKALEFGLKPILCVGETLQEREDEIYEAIVEEQVIDSLEEISAGQMNDIIIAYEPVWAIGTGLNATPKQASDIHALISKVVSKKFGPAISEELLILYGGSVNLNNAEEILRARGIDGALVGGASLKAEEFANIVKTAAEIKV